MPDAIGTIPVNRFHRRLHRRTRNAMMTIVVWLTTGLIMAMFLWIVGDLVYHGVASISWSFLVNAPQHAGRAGGIGPIVICTALILLVSLAVACRSGWARPFC